jgi:[ribosomal protein S5]-alanine N-acetyltransferase
VIRVRREAAARLPARLDAPPPAVTAIRAVRPSDADALLDLRVRNRAFLAPWDPLRPASFFTRAGQAEWIALQQRAWADDRGYGFVMLDSSDDDRIVGGINLFNIVRSARQSAGMGYWVDEASGSRGHATAAVRLMAVFAFQHLGLHRLEPAVMPRNARSTRVMEKAGFRREGLAVRYLRIAGMWEDHALYALTAEDFAAQADGGDPARR